MNKLILFSVIKFISRFPHIRRRLYRKLKCLLKWVTRILFNSVLAISYPLLNEEIWYEMIPLRYFVGVQHLRNWEARSPTWSFSAFRRRMSCCFWTYSSFCPNILQEIQNYLSYYFVMLPRYEKESIYLELNHR